MTSRFLAILGILLVVCAFPVTGAERLPEADVDRVVRPLIDEDWCVGMVVGVIDAGGPRVFGYGSLSPEDSRTPGGDTVFEIGSITKAFTGVLLAEMAGRGEVALDDPVQKFLPRSVKLKQRGDAPITLEHLATHRSGLPRLPPNLAAKDTINPYASYTVEQMYAAMRDVKPAHEAGETFEYSNFGAGVLGHVLALRAGKGYEQLVTERLLRPLGMSDTAVTLNESMKSRLAPGHTADGDPTPNWDSPTLAAAGALRSTANDMLRFLAAGIEAADAPSPASTKLADAFALSFTPRASAGSDTNDVGLGWHIARKHGIVWHNGGTGGYNAYCAFVPGKKVGAVVLVNTFGDCADLVGYAVMRRLLGEDFDPPAKPKVVKLDPDTLDARTGRYAILPGFSLTITRDGERLYCQATDQPRFRIYPQSETEFFYKVVDARLTFKLDKQGRAYMLTLNQNGLKLPGLRVVETAATQPTTQASH
jgi:CubicO group peptidase (beta-lactamase class C family)